MVHELVHELVHKLRRLHEFIIRLRETGFTGFTSGIIVKKCMGNTIDCLPKKSCVILFLTDKNTENEKKISLRFHYSGNNEKQGKKGDGPFVFALLSNEQGMKQKDRPNLVFE